MKDLVHVLGAEYKIVTKKYNEDSRFEKLNCNGYCISNTKTIVIGDLNTFKEYENDTEEEKAIETRDILKHEIVHAFFSESGLKASSNGVPYGWAENEEMVDWIALQGEKIYQAWKEVEVVL